MTGRQRIEMTLAHREPPLVPLDLMFSPPARSALQAHLGTADVDAALGVDILLVGPGGGKPLYASPAEYGPTITDQWGVVWSTSDINHGSPIGPSVAEPDLGLVPRPDANDPKRFEGLRDVLAAERERYRVIGCGDMWERAGFMRGLHHLLLDVALNPDFVAGLLDILCDYILATIKEMRRCFYVGSHVAVGPGDIILVCPVSQEASLHDKWSVIAPRRDNFI